MSKRNGFLPLLLAVAFAYLTFGAITNVAGAIVPKIKDTYNVSGSASTLLASVFFIAYGIMSVPFGELINKKGKKFTLLLGSLITTIGVFIFATVPGYFANMSAMFICGIGITAIQVSANPLVKEISNPEKYTRNLTLFMVLFGVGSTIAPYIVTFIKEQGLEWNFTYLFFTIISLIMLVSLALPAYPKETTTDSKSPKAKGSIGKLLQDPLMLMYTLAIFLYVGVEVGIAINIGLFLEDFYNISGVFGDKAEGIKNATIGNYWLGLLLGRLVGGAVLDKIPTKKAIQIFISGAAMALGVTLFAHDIASNITLFANNLALPLSPQHLISRLLNTLSTINDITLVSWAFPAIGFFISIMFPSIYGLALESYDESYAGTISGILCTAIIGGAVIGPIITKVAEVTGSIETPNWYAGMLIAFACYAYIFTVGIWAKPKVKKSKD